MKILIISALLILFILLILGIFIQPPWKSFRGELPELTQTEKATSQNLKRHLDKLCIEIGQRNFQKPENLQKSIDYIKGELEGMGYNVKLEEVPKPNFISYSRASFFNIIAEKVGTKFPEDIIVVGGHYDSVAGHDTYDRIPCVGADDNASAIAVLLELARLLKDTNPEKTLRFVAFCNEEPPFFNTEFMGSYIYAKNCKDQGENIEAMFCLEMLGYYSDLKGSQSYPYPLNTILRLVFGDKGNFVAFISNINSKGLMVESLKTFRNSTQFPSHGVALPSFVTGVDWSDHRSFWGQGYKAIMIGDTALYRNKYYHTPEDTPDKLDYDKMARVTMGIKNVIESKAKK